MKKFVGYVNGKSFDNEKDFSKAALEAINSDDDNLAISSYYNYGYDNSEDVSKDDQSVETDNVVSESEYLLGDRKPDKVLGDIYEFNFPEGLEDKLKKASNKDFIRSKVDGYLKTFGNAIKEREDKNKQIQYEIENLQDELYENDELIKEIKGREKYYNKIIDILDTEKVDEVEVKEEPVIPNAREVLGIKKDGSIFSFLKELGLLG